MIERTDTTGRWVIPFVMACHFVAAATSDLNTGHAQEPAALTARSEWPGGQIDASYLEVQEVDDDPAPVLPRTAIILHPPTHGIDGRGRLILKPNVEMTDVSLQTHVADPAKFGPIFIDKPVVTDLAVPLYPRSSGVIVSEGNLPGCRSCSPRVCRFPCLRHLICAVCGPPSIDTGVGPGRLAYAPFEMDASQPLNSFLIRFDAAYDHEFPDRAEYFWAKSPGPRGPTPIPARGERSVDYQDLRFRFELGGPRFSVATDLPLRFVNPSINDDHGGMGDMWVTTKLVMLDGERLQITQILRTYINTGSPTSGTGTGHVSLEPGVLAGWKWNERTRLHGELKYWFPLGADPIYAGEVFRYGLGVSHVWYDGDAFAFIPTLELVGWSVLAGHQTPSDPAAAPVPVDGLGICSLYPGARFVFDTNGDCGMFELGIGTGFALTRHHWYDSLFRIDFRWSY